MEELALSPFSATALFIAACIAGMQYRKAWKAEGPRWQLWVYGLIAGGALLTLGFLPMAP